MTEQDAAELKAAVAELQERIERLEQALARGYRRLDGPEAP